MRFLYGLKSNSTYKAFIYPGWQRGPKLCMKLWSNQTNRSTPKKTGTKIYERAKRGGRKPPSTAAPMVIEQYTLLP